MQQLALDSFRSGMRDRNTPANTLGVWSGAAPIHTYVMPHTPGNTARSWRRQFFADINHGMKQLNLFVMAPLVQMSGPNAGEPSENKKTRATSCIPPHPQNLSTVRKYISILFSQRHAAVCS